MKYANKAFNHSCFHSLTSVICLGIAAICHKQMGGEVRYGDVNAQLNVQEQTNKAHTFMGLIENGNTHSVYFNI